MGNSNRKKRRNPSIVLVISFLIVIVVGTFLLSLPVSHPGKSFKFIDLLFTSTSATCVTGLMTLPAIDFSIFGQIVILLMIQIGGLGLMTFVAVANLIIRKSLQFEGRNLMKEALNKEDLSDVGKYIRMIVIYTFVIELLGFIFLLPVIYDGRGYSIFQTVFLSISAFCNAGIEIFGLTSLAAFRNNVTVNIVVSLLIIFGGIGFAVWLDIVNSIKRKRELKADYPLFSRLKISTRIVLIVSAVLIVLGTLLVFIFEYNGALKGYPIGDKLLMSYFSSVTLRTAGFSSFDFSTLSSASKILMCLFMIIGASPGSTGGGMKTTTFFVIILGLITIFRGSENIHVFNRKIVKKDFVRAVSIFFLYLTMIFISIIVLSFTESAPTLDVLYEICSAIGTVGLSTGVTSVLSTVGKAVIIILMFVGRVGPITVFLLLRKERTVANRIEYPKTDILLG